jgi:hypothetical protein
VPIATDAVHPDPEQCVSEQTTRLLSAFEHAEDDGLEFDQGCMNQLLARYEVLGCESFATLQIQLGDPTLAENFGCSLYHGSEVDGICEAVTGTSWSDCATGYACFDAGCQPIRDSAGVGGACTVNLSAYALDCDPGLYCTPDAGCQPCQAEGEPCVDGGDGTMRCAPDHWCEVADGEFEGTCQPLWAAGDACNPTITDYCDGWCFDSEESEDPTIGSCVAVPGVCLYTDIQPPT